MIPLVGFTKRMVFPILDSTLHEILSVLDRQTKLKGHFVVSFIVFLFITMFLLIVFELIKLIHFLT